MKFSKSVREKVEARANKLCEYRLSPLEFSPDPFSIEHILPLSTGGTNDSENLALSCQGCNGSKSVKIEAFDLVSQTIARFCNPCTDSWDEHFVWNEDFTEMIGLTAKGRVTIKILQLNRQRVVNLRRLLILAGEHPTNLED
jgi:HNH endonuclease